MDDQAKQAYQEALKRIENWQQGEELDLSIWGLTEIPKEIQGLTELRRLRIVRPFWAIEEISDLISPLAYLTELEYLNLSQCEIRDLTPLSQLIQLKELHISSNKISDLSPLSQLTQLQKLDASKNKISNLNPLSQLTQLQELDICFNQISDLSPLSLLTHLKLDISCNEISKLDSLSQLIRLKAIDVSLNKISDLSPLSQLSKLKELDISITPVSDFTPLSQLNGLERLRCNRNRIRTMGHLLWFLPNLEVVIAYDTELPDIPAEILSKDPNENCLPALRAHLLDLVQAPQELKEAKLMILGNGRVGKTQLCRYLRGEGFEAESDSTHGIILTSAPVMADEVEDAGEKFQIWDFGGQDIYHGTHSLFMRSRAVFIVAWTPSMENQQTHTHNGMTFRNYPLLYWLKHIETFAGTKATVIVVQTQCDTRHMEQSLTDEVNQALSKFHYSKVLHFSAKTKRSAGLKEALAEAYQELDKPLIGPGRQAVKQQLEVWREQDALLPAKQRQHPWLEFPEFEQLCQQQQNISDTELFADFLHHSGTVFYQDHLFSGRLILDQAWMLEAIYSIFHRERCYRMLKRHHGRFSLEDLDTLLWQQQGHNQKEQAHFLEMMQSSGICFRLTPYGIGTPDSEVEYLAPELLPEQAPEDFDLKWNRELTSQTAYFDYELLPASLLRHFMAEVGGEAGLVGSYWKNGFLVAEQTTQSRAWVQLTMNGDWQGQICIQTQSTKSPSNQGQPDQAQELLEQLTKQLIRIEQKLGLCSQRSVELETAEFKTIECNPNQTTDTSNTIQALDFQSPKPSQAEWYVSYAWQDAKSEAGKTREEKVDALCEEAKQKGHLIMRDKDVLQHGDSIQRYMNRLAQGGRIFIFLSRKYLESYYCMYELTQIWRWAQQDGDQFTQKVRLYTLDDVSLTDIANRLKYSSHWQQETQRWESLIEQHGFENLTISDYAEYRAIQQFAHQVGDILSVFKDRIQARDFQDFLKYGFEGAANDES